MPVHKTWYLCIIYALFHFFWNTSQSSLSQSSWKLWLSLPACHVSPLSCPVNVQPIPQHFLNLATRQSKRIQNRTTEPTEIPPLSTSDSSPEPSTVPPRSASQTTLPHSSPSRSEATPSDRGSETMLPSSSPSLDQPGNSEHDSAPSSPRTHTPSESSDDLPYPESSPCQNMSDTNMASVKHNVITHPPMITDGKLSPKIIWEFEIRCNVYFMNIKGGVADDQKVRKLLGSFKNTLIQDWMSTKSNRLIQLSFTDFMNEFRERWLPTNWERNVLTQMLGAHLDPTKQTIEAWASQIPSHNVSLCKTKSHMTEEALHHQLEIMLDEELCTFACEANVAEISGLRDWMTKVKELDNHRQIDLKQMAQFFNAAFVCAAKRQNTGAHPNTRASFSNSNNQSNSTRNTSTTASSLNPTLYPLRLTDEERRLLHDHEGCLKCWEFYTGHRARQSNVTLLRFDKRLPDLGGVCPVVT